MYINIYICKFIVNDCNKICTMKGDKEFYSTIDGKKERKKGKKTALVFNSVNNFEALVR